MDNGDHNVLVSECRLPILTNGSGGGGSPAGDRASIGAPAAGKVRTRVRVPAAADVPRLRGLPRSSNSHAPPSVCLQVAGWTPLLVFAAAVAALGSALPVGYNIGVINTPAAVSHGSGRSGARSRGACSPALPGPTLTAVHARPPLCADHQGVLQREHGSALRHGAGRDPA